MERKFKFPIAAISLFLFTVIALLNEWDSFYLYLTWMKYVPERNFISLLLICAYWVLVVFLFCRKRIQSIQTTCFAILMLYIYPFVRVAGSILKIHIFMGYDWNRVTIFFSTLAFLGLFLLAKQHTSANNSIKRAKILLWILEILMAVYAVMSIVVSSTAKVGYNTFLIPNLCHAAALSLLGIWIYDPYQKPYNTLNDEFFVPIARHICFLLCTFGIWQLHWIYKTTEYTNSLDSREKRSPLTSLLLCLFVPFYFIYWNYSTAQRIDQIARRKNYTSDIATVCLVLSIFFGIVPPIIMQSKINDLLALPTVEDTTIGSIENELRSLKKLCDDGILSQEEFDEKKKQLLNL